MNLIELDPTTAINPENVMSVELDPTDLKVKVIFNYGGFVKTSASLDEVKNILGFIQINAKQAINPKFVSSVVLDGSFKTRVFAEGGGYLFSDYGFKETMEMFNG